MREALRRSRRLGVRAQDDPHLGERSLRHRRLAARADRALSCLRCVARRSSGCSINRRSSMGRCAKTRRSRRNSTPLSNGSARPALRRIFSRHARPNWDGHGDELRPAAHQSAPAERQAEEAEPCSPRAARPAIHCSPAPSRSRNAGADSRRHAELKHLRAPLSFASPTHGARRNHRRPDRRRAGRANAGHRRRLARHTAAEERRGHHERGGNGVVARAGVCVFVRVDRSGEPTITRERVPPKNFDRRGTGGGELAYIGRRKDALP